METIVTFITLFAISVLIEAAVGAINCYRNRTSSFDDTAVRLRETWAELDTQGQFVVTVAVLWLCAAVIA